MAYACGAGQYTGMLAVFAIIGFIPLAYMRAAPGSPAPGMLFGVLYGVILIFTVPRAKELDLTWRIVSLQPIQSLLCSECFHTCRFMHATT